VGVEVPTTPGRVYLRHEVSMTSARATGLICPSAWLEDGWQDEVVLQFDQRGRISQIGGDPTGLPRAPGPVVPGMSNAHSHAFQWAMAGLAERAVHADDSFWSWRQTMYQFVDALDPDQIEAVAAAAYVAMLEAGFTSVAEFHYLHHAPDGTPYDDPAELSLRIAAAGRMAGIGLTLLPVLYAHGGVGGQPAGPAQRRFLGDPDLVLRCRERVASAAPEVRLGAALHSLRAVTGEQIDALIAALPGDAPVHIHVAEQRAEVEACLQILGARPVAWLADRVELSPRWGLVHATHVDADEVRRAARSGAVAVLCPTTEANLGDGLFPAAAWLGEGGAFAIGTDSHVSVDPAEELRLLEVGQRLIRERRNVLRLGDDGHVGAGLWAAAGRGGASALGRESGRIAVGCLADLVVLDAEAPRLAGRSRAWAVDTWVMAGGAALVREVWVAGRQVVRDGVHVRRSEVGLAYRRAVAGLGR
jgi:formimidoylglutamate deiminase